MGVYRAAELKYQGSTDCPLAARWQADIILFVRFLDMRRLFLLFCLPGLFAGAAFLLLSFLDQESASDHLLHCWGQDMEVHHMKS